MVLVVVNLLALTINMAGIADPAFFTTMDERDLGFIIIKPNAIWFACGIAFMILFCVCSSLQIMKKETCYDFHIQIIPQVPSVIAATCNVKTFKPRVKQVPTNGQKRNGPTTTRPIQENQKRLEEGRIGRKEQHQKK